MEDLKRELELGELKRENLRKSLEQANAQLSSILMFTFQWKELENHFDLVQQNIEKRLAVLESREKEELEGKEKQLNLVEDFHSKEKELSLVQISLEECTKQLKAKEEELTSIKDSIVECTKELESKQQQLDVLRKTQEEISGMIKWKEKQLDLFEEACGKRLQEANVKEKHLSTLERSLEERLKKLESEKSQFEARVKEFELREKQFALVQKAIVQRSKELESREKELTNAPHSQVSSENPSSFFLQALGITNTESVNPVLPNQIKRENPEHFIFNASETLSGDLQSILNKHLNEPDLRKNEVLSALQMSPDPAKFVLDVMLGISSQHKKKGGTGFEQSVLEISLLMLEQLLQVSPHVQPEVKADALKLANEWKSKMKLNAENSIEMLGFLQFVAAFGLLSSFNRDEIFQLLGTIAQHQQARNICRVLGFTDKIPDFVGSLIARKQYIEAVRFVCALDCKDKCPPEKLLNLFVEDITRVARERCMIGKNSPEVQQKATDEQIAALKSIIECVKDCKLESCVPVKVIEKWIAELEKLKTNIKLSTPAPPPAPAPAPAVQPNVQSWKTCDTGPSVPENRPSLIPKVQRQFQGGIYAFTPGTQPQGLSNKRARDNCLVINSYTPQVATGSTNIRPASPHGLGVPRNQGVTHFSSAANKEVDATRQSNAAEEKYPIHNRPNNSRS